MNEIITIQKAQVLDIFTKRELIAPLLEKIEDFATKQVFDASTDKGRKSIASMAYRVAQSKTYIENHGKELAAELKELPKLVDSNRKYARDFLDELKDRIRKPLDEWEAEQAEIKLREEIEEAHGAALIEHIKWELKYKEEQERIAKERAEYEARVLAEAERKAKIDAEERLRKEMLEAESRAIAAEKEAQRAIDQAKIDADIAVQKAAAQAEEERKQRELIEQYERERIENEKNAVENVQKIHTSIINDFLSIGLNQAQAQYILDAVYHGKIRALKIEY